jgi:hypothetical protein
VVSLMENCTLAPILNTTASSAPTSRSMPANSSITSASTRASQPKARAAPPSASMAATSGASLSAWRRATQAT